MEWSELQENPNEEENSDSEDDFKKAAIDKVLEASGSLAALIIKRLIEHQDDPLRQRSPLFRKLMWIIHERNLKQKPTDLLGDVIRDANSTLTAIRDQNLFLEYDLKSLERGNNAYRFRALQQLFDLIPSESKLERYLLKQSSKLASLKSVAGSETSSER